MLKIQNLTQRFGQTIAVNNISFAVQQGEVVGLLGPNGAGKTTTMRIISGYLIPTAGTVEIDGQVVTVADRILRRRIGYLPENNPLYDTMRVYEYLEFIAQSKQVADVTAEIKQVVQQCALQDKIAATLSELSKGYRQRVGLAAALLGDPALLILDEPTSGLDPNQAADVRELIRSLGRKKSILFSTHILQEVQAVCDRAVIIDHGKIVAAGTMTELSAQAQGQRSVVVTIVASEVEVLPALQGLAAAAKIERLAEQRYRIQTGVDQDLRRSLYKLCVARQWDLLELQQTEVSLEEVFRQLTKA